MLSEVLTFGNNLTWKKPVQGTYGNKVEIGVICTDIAIRFSIGRVSPAKIDPDHPAFAVLGQHRPEKIAFSWGDLTSTSSPLLISSPAHPEGGHE